MKTPGQADVKSGAGMMAIRAGVKLAPVYIGTKKRIFRKTPIIIGEPFEPEYTGRKGTAEEYTANAHEVMRRAYALGGSNAGDTGEDGGVLLRRGTGRAHGGRWLPGRAAALCWAVSYTMTGSSQRWRRWVRGRRTALSRCGRERR